MKELEELRDTVERLINPIYEYYKGIDTEIDEDRVTPSNRRFLEKCQMRDETEKEFVSDIITYMDEILDAFREYEDALEEMDE